MIDFALIDSVLTMSTAALLRLRSASIAITHFNSCTLLKYTHPGTQRDMHTSSHTNPTQTHIERAHNHMKDKNTDTIYHAHSHIHANIHTNTHIHHMYISTLAHESKETESNHVRRYTIAQQIASQIHAYTQTHEHTQSRTSTHIRAYTQS